MRRRWFQNIESNVQKDINARIYVLSFAAVLALYVLVSIAVALARFSGQEVNAKGGYRLDVPAQEELLELGTDDFVP